MPVEIELKFVAGGPEALERLLAAERLGPARLGPVSQLDEIDRYLDSSDRRLAAAHWACRLRMRGGTAIVSLKGPAERGSDSALHRRPELEGPAAATLDVAGWPPSPARQLLDRLRGGAPLEERLALAQRRSVRAVIIGPDPIGTLSLDEVQVRHANDALGHLWIVEMELLPGMPEHHLPRLRRALELTDGLSADPMTKLERGLAMLDARSDAVRGGAGR